MPRLASALASTAAPRAHFLALRCQASRPAAPAWPNGKRRRRLDDVCCDLSPEYSKNVIQSFILAGQVYVDEQKVTKCGHQVRSTDHVDVRAEVPKYVCRAGAKLEHALDAFGVDAAGVTALDAGVSTGGFTDCLLQRGAARVYAVDVGYGQVAERVRTHPRVVLMERTNLRTLAPAALPERVALATLDLSFISLLKVLPAVRGVLAARGRVVALIKPQFEAGPERVQKGGVVRDARVHAAVVEEVTAGFAAAGFVRRGLEESPLRGAAAGNKEFLALFELDA